MKLLADLGKSLPKVSKKRSIPAPSAQSVDLRRTVLAIDNEPADIVDLGDLTSLIDYLFISFTELDCFEEANIDGDEAGSVDLGYLTAA